MNVHVHINRPSSTRFQARVRLPGRRKYRLVGTPTKESHKALLTMTREFSRGRYKRGDVLIIADYYEPVVLAEIVRK